MKIGELMRALVAGTLATAAGGAAGGGFGIATQSGSGTGNANAGGAAVVEDASVAWSNPAGMTFLPRGKQVSAGLTILKTSHKFHDNGSIGAFSFPGSGDGGDGGGWAYVPNAYFTMDINPEWNFGLAINAPFGLKTEYDAGWRGQLLALKSEVKTININPSFAYRASDTFSIGAGVSVQKLDAELTNCAPTPFSVPPACVNSAKLEADDVGYGFNLGLMFQATPATRFGASYRSSIKYDLEGTVTFSGAPAGNSNIKTDLRVPDSASFSVFHQAGRQWELMGDITWTKWGTVQQLVVDRSSGPLSGMTVTTLAFDWDDTWRFGVGANYKMDAQTKLRFGLAYDETPTNDITRTPRLPGQDRTWVAFGVQYKPSRSGTLDIGYAHEFIRDANINAPAGAGNTACAGSCLRGSVDNTVDILTIQYSHQF